MASDYAPFQGMATSRDTSNPLRPYYIPPSIGHASERASSIPSPPNASTSRVGLGKSARDLLSELDYGGPLLDRDGPSIGEVAKKIVDQAIWKYTSVLLAQPFDVAKTLLQVRSAEDDIFGLEAAPQMMDKRFRAHELRASESDSDEDSPSYFTPTKPPTSRLEDGSPTRRHRSRGRASPPDRSESTTPVPPSRHSHRLHIKHKDSVLEVLGLLWTQSGATGLWRATNATFVYNVLVKALESWTRSLLCALVNVPDPSALSAGPSEMVASAMGGIDVADSPSPLLVLGVSVAAAGIAGILLSPLDLIRTRLIVTPTTLPPRATIQLLRTSPLLINSTLLPITLLHSTTPVLLTSSAPLLLKSALHIDPLTTPNTYSLLSFLTSSAELFLKLPLETLLRRAQVSVLQVQHSRAYSAQRQARLNTLPNARLHNVGLLLDPDLKLIVAPGQYTGIFGTVYSIIWTEGSRNTGLGTPTASRVATPVAPRHGMSGSGLLRQGDKKGQGVRGLWRGWRVGMWGLCGVWLAGAMGSGNNGGEF